MGIEARNRCDEDLLLATTGEPEAFAAFYRRHVRALTAYFWRRVRDPEVAADLTAETFAAALAGARRFDPERGSALAWLYGIAHRRLAHYERRGAVEARARRRMGMERLELHDAELERLEADAVAHGPDSRLLSELEALPAEQRAAIEDRVLHERDYDEIARRAGTSEPVVRKRVSRGLAALRARRRGGTT